MALQWYCQVGDEEIGPLSSSDLKRLCRKEQLLPEHLVKQGTGGRWVKASQVKGLFTASEASATRAQQVPPGPRVSVSASGATPVVPAGVPVGLPVGVPVGAVPAGMIPSGLPVGIVVTNTASTLHQAAEAPPKKRDPKLYVVIGLAACIAVLAGVGGAMALGVFGGGKADKKVADKPAEKPPADENFDPEAAVESEPTAETKPAEKTKPGPKRAVASKDGSSKGKNEAEPKADTPGQPTPAQEKAIRAVTQWHNASTFKSVLIGNVQVQLGGVWLDGDARSTKTETASASGVSARKLDGVAGHESGAGGGIIDSSAAPLPPVQEAAAKTTSTGRYVFIELHVTNLKGPGALNYKSWNGGGKKPQEVAAVLLDGEGKVCPLVDRLKVATTARRQTAEVAPGESLTDLLVFEVPASDFDHLRLVLPYAAVGRDKFLGLQIPRDRVAAHKDDLVKTPLAPAALVRPLKPSVAADADEPPAPSAPPAPKGVDPDDIKGIVERDAQRAKKLEAERKEAEGKAAAKAQP